MLKSVLDGDGGDGGSRAKWNDLVDSACFANRTVGIVGLGLIGGSLARRLVSRGVDVIAWNHRDHPYAQARADGIRCMPTLASLAQARPDVIVLCNPLKAMPSMLAALAPVIDRDATTLTDVGSVKGMVREQVVEAGLADCYVGAHPMAGNELSGWSAADPALYDDALWAVSVDDSTDFARFVAVASMILDGVGDRLIVLNDDVHDRAAALISHMPHVVATALINQLTGDPDRNIAAALAAGSWRDMTRVALTDPDRTRAMVEEDAVNVASLLRSMAARLTAVADALHGGDGGDGDGTDDNGGSCMDEDVIARFFADGQPFRDYKAALRAADGMHDALPNAADSAIALSPLHWRDDLLASARRGEHVVGLSNTGDAPTALVRVYSAM
ncbi:prephenate dehydrogenase [Bifidobacterium jacchi]|uniref:Prephenate dehydrogenase/arogenate dehydrogenase family protein n=1 Tax=Bifidobacterium jacchi TaxID=2490545 RepID=A0A5N5REZ7_9BIFI|nr:prephenate dehydrogenase/arogenate dehydrogenase family protein [Bifidobacterium jacchi]KAB5605826.1 prephenate dehydrogenase/arogenate dehydrogenase family protein [Bifidobacterium jacchi]